MIEVGKLVTVTLEGCNYGFPDEYLRGMGLSHIEGNRVEGVREGVLYVVIGRSEYYTKTKLGIMSVRTNDLFVVDEDDVRTVPIHTEPTIKTTQDEAVEALKAAISNDIELQFIELYGEHGEGCPDDFDYEDWYEVAREVAYNAKYIMILRNFIEGE
jgi:hypothetical protein